MSKKIRKVVAKFDLGHQFGKQMGLPDPMGDTLYGSDRALSPTEKAEKAAKDAAKAAGSVTPESVPVAVSDDTMAAREAQKKRQLAAAGLSGTILTGSSGLSAPATTSMKSLLGS
jgi:hypothetical protein